MSPAATTCRLTDAALAADLAEEAGKLLLAVREEVGFDHPWVLGDEGDSQANALLLRRLHAERPGDAVLSEEAHDDLERLQSDRVWIIDPLDGTREFSTQGRDDWAVHIALWQRPRRPPTAANHRRRGRLAREGEHVHRSDTVTATPTVGVPGTIRIAVSANRPPAVLYCMPADAGVEPVAIGSAGAKAMAVIDGDVDAYLHAGGQWEWDSAAPAGVILAAGMHASRLDGSPMHLQPARPVPARLRDVSRRGGADCCWVRSGWRDCGWLARAGLKSTVCSPGPPHPSRRCRDVVRSCGCTTPPTARCARWRPGRPATMYVCGITPYDATHLGHAATYLAFDLIHRLWLDLGHDVHYVQNVTDVDDPLFERANRDGIDWRDLAAREVALFREDMAALRVLPPREYVAATEAVAEVVELVEKMLASGAAYVVDDAEYPDVYFRADATPQFGYESGYDRDTMLRLFAERGGDPDRAGQDRPARRAVVACRAARGAELAVTVRRRAGPAGTSNARRSRSAASAAAWTSRAAAAT